MTDEIEDKDPRRPEIRPDRKGEPPMNPNEYKYYLPLDETDTKAVTILARRHKETASPKHLRVPTEVLINMADEIVRLNHQIRRLQVTLDLVGSV
jgi:hypothetical protein